MVGWIDGFKVGLIDTVGLELGKLDGSVLSDGWLLPTNDGPVEKLGSFEGMRLGTADTDGLKLGLSDGAELLEGSCVGSTDGR